jgi:hypothetical protein
MARGYDTRDGLVTQGVASGCGKAAHEGGRSRVPGHLGVGRVRVGGDLHGDRRTQPTAVDRGPSHHHPRSSEPPAAARAATASTPPPPPRVDTHGAGGCWLRLPEHLPPHPSRPGPDDARRVGQRLLPPRWPVRPGVLAQPVATPASLSARCPARQMPSPRTRTAATACPAAAHAGLAPSPARSARDGSAWSSRCAASGSRSP